MEERDIVVNLNKLENRCYKIGNEFTKKISDRTNDARILTFFHFSHVIRSAKLFFILKSEYMDERDWFVNTYLLKWNQNWPFVSDGSAGLIVNDHTLLMEDFNQFMRVAYIHAYFPLLRVDLGYLQGVLISRRVRVVLIILKIFISGY